MKYFKCEECREKCLLIKETDELTQICLEAISQDAKLKPITKHEFNELTK